MKLNVKHKTIKPFEKKNRRKPRGPRKSILLLDTKSTIHKRGKNDELKSSKCKTSACKRPSKEDEKTCYGVGENILQITYLKKDKYLDYMKEKIQQQKNQTA